MLDLSQMNPKKESKRDSKGLIPAYGGKLKELIIKDEDLISESFKTAENIANLSLPSLFLAKESVNYAYNSSLSQGVEYERKLFYSTFSLNDQNEGMEAFIEKRKPKFNNC